MSQKRSPIGQSVTHTNPFQDIIEPFVAQLNREGLHKSTIWQLLQSAHHFLVWLHLLCIPLASIDNSVLLRFRHHVCRCPGLSAFELRMIKRRRSGSRVFMSGALRLVRFLEETGRIPHLGELDRGLDLLRDFMRQRERDGYPACTRTKFWGAGRHLLVWLHGSRIALQEMNELILIQFLEHDCVCPGTFKRPCGIFHRGYIDPFLAFLVERGVMSPPSAPETDPEEDRFRTWLRQHRGICESRIRRLVQLIRPIRAELGTAPEGYNALRIREVLLSQFPRVSCHGAQALAGAMRMYLRFLAATGECSPILVDAVPATKVWKLASLPKYLPADDIEKVIDSCDTTTAVGIRDKAILLLLARLALRAGDIMQLRFADIDWRNALIRVSGKSQRQVALPLPQDVGDAIIAYIEFARPRVSNERIFLGAKAPYRPFSSSSPVSGTVRRALKRAGIDKVHSKGAHLFRHSAATNMVRSGVTPDVISALLRHQSMETTKIYAKVDRPMLLEVAQPWIGGQS